MTVAVLVACLGLFDLAAFASRIPLSPGRFALTGVVARGIALLMVSYQALRAA